MSPCMCHKGDTCKVSLWHMVTMCHLLVMVTLHTAVHIQMSSVFFCHVTATFCRSAHGTVHSAINLTSITGQMCCAQAAIVPKMRSYSYNAALVRSRGPAVHCLRVLQMLLQGDLVGGFLAFFIELAAMKDPNVKEGVMASGRPFVATLSLFCILVVMLFRPQWWVQNRTIVS